MVTQETTGKLRISIGQRRRRLQEKLDEENPTEAEIGQFNLEETTDLITDLIDSKDHLNHNLQELQILDAQWKNIIKNNSEEIGIWTKYTATYGDYSKFFDIVPKQIEEIKKLYLKAKQQLDKLDKNQANAFPDDLQDSDNLIAFDAPLTSNNPTPPPLQIPTNQPNVTLTSNTTPTGQPINPTPSPTPTPEQLLPLQMSQLLNLHTIKVQLPQMTLPSFSGDIEKYIEFKDSFESVMGHLQLDELTKLHYLKSSLSGEPADLLRSLPLTQSNFVIAMKTLEDQYGGTTRLKHALLLKLRKLPDLSTNTDPADLQHFIIQAGMIFDQLCSMGFNVDNISTSDIIESKLPKRIIHKLYSQGPKDTPSSAKQLIEKIKEIARTENLVSEIHNKKSNGQRHTTTMSAVTQHGQRMQNKDRRFPGQDQKTKQRVNSPCAFCVEERMMHHPHLCRKYASIQERKQRATDLCLCYKCLGIGHPAKQCSRNCHNCNGNHHEAICPKIQGQNQQHGPSRNQNSFNGNNAMGQQSQNHHQPAHAQSQQQPVNMLTRNSNGFGSGNSNGFGNRNGPQGYQRRNLQTPTRSYMQNVQNQRPLQPIQRPLLPINRGQTHAVNTIEEPTEEEYNVTHTTFAVEEETEHMDSTTLETTVGINEMDTDSTDNRQQPIIMMALELPALDSDGNEHLGTVFFDSGSNASYIKSSFADKLKITPNGTKRLRVNTFGSNESHSILSNILSVKIKTKKDTVTLDLCEIGHIANDIITTKITDKIYHQLAAEKPVQLSRQLKDVDILIGLDHYLLILGQITSVRLQNGLQLHITDCGPIVSGKEQTIQQNMTFTNINTDGRDDELCQQLQRFWELETIGIQDINPHSKSETEANQIFETTTTRNPDGRYVVRLPFSNKNDIPSNRALAHGRLQSALRQLGRNSELFDKYAKIFKEQLELGFIEEVPCESHSDGPVTHYLPHHPIVKETSKTTKVRIVYDGSAKTSRNKLSLNDHLLTGEKLLPEIAGVLIRIRQKPILISADIEKAFLQLELHPEDRDATRFLWINESTMESKCFRFKRVPFGLKSPPFLLNKTVKEHLNQYKDCPTAKEMSNSVYVDNVYIGVNNPEEAKKFYLESKQIFGEAKMNLTQYVSNSTIANKYFSEKENTKPEERYQKLLGITWDTETDELLFSLPQTKTELLTKRIVLKRIAKSYDPSGIMSPSTLIRKLFFQTLSNKNHDWDAPLSEEQHKEWQKVIQCWTGDPWRIPRQMFTGDHLLNDSQMIELHVFTDASKAAYGTIAYLRIIYNNYQADSQFLMAKSRVAPSKTNHSIPQLEALALLTGVRLAHYCIRETRLPIKQTYIWSDSMCTLDSLQTSASSGSKFVRNRIKEILEKGDDFTFSHVPGKNNPADMLTRGTTFENLKNSSLWIQGPEFLQSTEPLPLRQNSLEPAIKLTTAVNITEPPSIDTERFSSFHRLLRTVMLIIHFITLGRLSTSDKVNRAKRLIYRLAQSTSALPEQTIRSLQLKKDSSNDLWIYTGRTEQRPLIFLPQGQIAQLIIMREHERNHHGSPTYTLYKLREQFWIPHGLSYIKRTLKHCRSCRKFNSRPYQHPNFATFPDIRIQPSKPFENAAVDFAGPLNALVNNITTKVWIVLYSCIYSRFISTELVTDITSSTFLHSLRRLSSLYGTPRTIYCDNAKQFHTVSEVIKSVKDQLLQSSMIDSTNLPEFHFIPPHSPWSGGVYERMIGLVKNSLLRAGTTTKIFDIEDLKTTLQECTGIVNCRPLGYVSVEDDITPLRPVDFVFPHGRLSSTTLLHLTPPLDFDNFPWKRRNLSEQWEQLSTITENFRQRWNKEYVQLLQSRADFFHKQSHPRRFEPKVGEIVLICQPDKKSTTWPMARILEVKERSAVLKTGKTKRIVEYPWKLLCPLETEIDLLEEKRSNSAERLLLTEKQIIPTYDAGNQNDSTNEESPETTSIPPADTQTTGEEEVEEQALPIRRSTRKRTMPNYFIALSTSALLIGLSAADTNISTTTSTTSDSEPHDWNLNLWITFFGIIMLLIGLPGILSILLCLHCMLNTIAHFISNFIWIIHQGLVTLWTSTTKSTPTTFIVILMLLTTNVCPCTEVASFQATDDVCTQSNDGTHCFVNKIVTLSLRPNGPVGCFKVFNNNDKLETIVEIQPLAIISTCNEKSNHFTRPFEIKHAFTHRWRRILHRRSMRKHSKNGRSCRVPRSVYGCPRFHKMLLFMRMIYAEPTSFAIYEIIQCPTWNSEMEIRVSINGNATIYTIQHGLPLQLPENISLIVTGFSMSPAPIHSATFIKQTGEQNGGVGYTLSPSALPGTPTKGLVGELQCPSAKDAEKFNCDFAEDLCKCTPKDTAVQCDCTIIDIEALLQQNQITADQGSEGNVEIRQMDGRIITRTESSSLLQIQLDFKNHSIHRINKEDNCSVTESIPIGCHSCKNGATINVKCFAEVFNEIEAIIECPSATGFINCSTSGTSSSIQLHFNQPKFVENCSISCGRIKNHFITNGTLTTEPTFAFNGQKGIIRSNSLVGEDTILDSIADFLESTWNSITTFIWNSVQSKIWFIVLILVSLITFCFFRRECRRHRRYIRMRHR
ncbi:unnamed protein product [Caenorhabditis nigoni]